MKTIAQIIDETIGVEGKYSNNPNDPGGETMWGITVAVARRYGYLGPMASMPRSTAVAIYTQEYYIKPGFAQVFARSAVLAQEMFDTGVNQGPGRAITYLQVALNAFNKGGTLYKDIKEDGGIGPGTLAALDGYLRSRGAMAIPAMLGALNAQQGMRYLEITRAREANETFVFGWFFNRVVV